MVASLSGDEDKILVDLLLETGLPKEWALILVFLRCRGETTSTVIEIFAELDHSTVVIALQELRRIKWVAKRDLMHEGGKGRPVHAYRLAIPFEKIVDILEKEERKRVEEIKKNIEQLKLMV